MGFRNPATSATAVDTGGGVIPGVKVYSDHGNPGSGVVEWRAYTATARGTLTSSQSGSGGSFFSLGLVGGPSAQLNLESAPAGGYTGVARLNDAATYDLGGADVVNLSGSGWQPLTLGAGFTVAGDCYIFRRAGWAAVVLTVLASGGWPANAPLLAQPLPAGTRPQKTAWIVGNISGSTTFALTKFDPTGQITIIPPTSFAQDFRVAYTYPTA